MTGKLIQNVYYYTLLRSVRGERCNVKEPHVAIDALHWRGVPLLELSSKRCTSGLVAGSCNTKEHALLKSGGMCPDGKCPDGGHLVACTLWVLMHINELAAERGLLSDRENS